MGIVALYEIRAVRYSMYACAPMDNIGRVPVTPARLLQVRPGVLQLS